MCPVWDHHTASHLTPAGMWACDAEIGYPRGQQGGKREKREGRGTGQGTQEEQGEGSELGAKGRRACWEEMLFGWETKEQEKLKWREREKERGLPKIQEERKNTA